MGAEEGGRGDRYGVEVLEGCVRRVFRGVGGGGGLLLRGWEKAGGGGGEGEWRG